MLRNIFASSVGAICTILIFALQLVAFLGGYLYGRLRMIWRHAASYHRGD